MGVERFSCLVVELSETASLLLLSQPCIQ